METYISLLRGINVSGKNKIKMDALRNLYESLGFLNVQSYIQSGNVIFNFKQSNSNQLAEKIQWEIKKKFAFHIPVLVHTIDDLHEIISRSPFKGKDESKQYVTFLEETSESVPTDAINKAKHESEIVSIMGKNIYLYCPDGYGRTKLSNTFFEKKLNQTATTRNWKTVQTLKRMAAELSRERN